MATVRLIVMLVAPTAVIARRGGRFLMFRSLTELENRRSLQRLVQLELFLRFLHQLELRFDRLNGRLPTYFLVFLLGACQGRNVDLWLRLVHVRLGDTVRPSDDDALGTDFQVVQRILSRVGVLDPLVRNERVSPWLTGLGPRSMKQQVESLILRSKLPTHKRLSST